MGSHTDGTAARTGRLLELDALRGIAALSVVVYHFTRYYGLEFGHADTPWFSLPNGRIGVHLFFMISGFVILMTLDRTKTVLDFACARFSRLYPIYWAAGLLTFAVVTWCGLPGREVDPLTALANITMCQGFFNLPLVDPSYWTLHVELCFYMLMGTIVFTGQRQRLNQVIAVLVLLDWGHTTFGAFSSLPGWWLVYRCLPLEFLYSFFMGIVFYQMRSGWKWSYAGWLAVALLGASSHGAWQHLVIIAGNALLMFVATKYPFALLRNSVLVFLGTISYSLYLVHQNIGHIIIRFGYSRGINGNWSILIAMAVSLALAVALTFLVERPANSWFRDRYRTWKARRATPVGLAPMADGVSG